MATSEAQRRVYFIANGPFGTHFAGGDIHFMHLARGALAAGHAVVFIGGMATKYHLEHNGIPAPVLLTDSKQPTDSRCTGVVGQLKLLFHYVGKLLRTRKHLSAIGPHDVVYAVSDYWVDTLPAIWAHAALKMMILHMRAPAVHEVLFSRRADIAGARLGALHYAVSQWLSLALFRRLANKKVLCVHPLSEEFLHTRGFSAQETAYIPVGLDQQLADRVAVQEKKYDLIWIGRIHPQKGLVDLVEILHFLSQNLMGFRAVLVGDVAATLAESCAQRGLAEQIEFSGLVQGERKFELIKGSRLMLIPSHHEGWPAVIGEALICRVPVVGYALPNYEPITQDLMAYTPCYQIHTLAQRALEMLLQLREGRQLLNGDKLQVFCSTMSVESMQHKFNALLAEHLAAQIKSS